jgi:Fe-S cluster biogenesis protein NfuA
MRERKEILEDIGKALDEIRPFLINDGGDITMLELTDDMIVRVRLEGNCAGCHVNQMTLRSGVEMTIRKYVPELKAVENVEMLEESNT